jgi:KDO2-lipid IV(A) lauroyltransferase
MLTAFLRLVGRLPLPVLHSAGAALGWLTYWSSPVYASRLRENVTSSGICADNASCRKLINAAVGEIGKGALEIAAVWFRDARDAAAFIVEVNNWPLVETAIARRKGIIFLTPHLGCFEVTALYAALRMPITVLYRPPHVRWLEPLMIAGRERAQARVAPANTHGVRMLYRALRKGEAIGLLPDHAPGEGEGEWADFFGRPAYTMTLAGRLAEATGAAVILAFAERLPRGRGFRLHLREPDEPVTGAAALNRAIERLIRECPAQYLWSYNRYKIPAGVRAPDSSGEAPGDRRETQDGPLELSKKSPRDAREEKRAQ